ncbi:hypothetical protein BaRGS_00021329 [Batillaria attramentaria]|uniref:C-type lectin domain-containing protein n=1 Tax=Batillaria attramentaria TaxID=370345 RepID=A0ABD0KKE2_9CAEN
MATAVRCTLLILTGCLLVKAALYYYQAQLDYASAVIRCQDDGLRLAAFPQQQGFSAYLQTAMDLAMSSAVANEIWIGMKHDGVDSFLWLDEGPVTWNIAHWEHGEPDNMNAGEVCVRSVGNLLRTTRCDMLRPFVCQDRGSPENVVWYEKVRGNIAATASDAVFSIVNATVSSWFVMENDVTTNDVKRCLGKCARSSTCSWVKLVNGTACTLYRALNEVMYPLMMY